MQEPSRFRSGPPARRSETLCGEVIDTESAHLVKATREPAAAAGGMGPYGRYFPYPCDP
jgi:hypothetical protein